MREQLLEPFPVVMDDREVYMSKKDTCKITTSWIKVNKKVIKKFLGMAEQGISINCEGGLDLVSSTSLVFRTPGVAQD